MCVCVAVEQEGAGGDPIGRGAVPRSRIVHQGVHCDGEHDSHWRRRRAGEYCFSMCNGGMAVLYAGSDEVHYYIMYVFVATG